MATATLTERSSAGAMVPVPFVVSRRERETADTWTLTLEPLDGDAPVIAPGQFMMVYVFGIGEVPISVSGPAFVAGPVILTVRTVAVPTKQSVMLCGSIGVLP